MVSKTLLVKIDRTSAWVLLFLMITFIVTGYSMTSEYGMGSVVNVMTALRIHTGLSELVVIFFAIHAGIQVYFALLRWGILGRKK